MLHVLYVWIIQCFSHPLMLGLFSQMIRLNRVEITGYGTLWDFNISHPFHSCCKGCDFCLFVCFMFKNQISHKADFFPQNQIFSLPKSCFPALLTYVTSVCIPTICESYTFFRQTFLPVCPRHHYILLSP